MGSKVGLKFGAHCFEAQLLMEQNGFGLGKGSKNQNGNLRWHLPRVKERSLNCDFGLYYKLPKSDPSVVYELPTQTLMLFICSQFISMEIVQHQLDCSTNNKHIH